MNTLEIILIAIIWLSYGVFNSWQHDWHKEYKYIIPISNIIFAPIALCIRIVRGVFFWKGDY